MRINISGQTTDIVLQLYYAWRVIGSSKSYFNSEHLYFIEIIGMRFPQWNREHTNRYAKYKCHLPDWFIVDQIVKTLL